MKLLLAGDAKMIVVAGLTDVSPRRPRVIVQTGDQLRAQPWQPPLLDQECQPAFRAGFPGAMVAIDADQFDHDIGSLLRFDEYIQRRGYGKSSRAHLAADQKIEAETAVAYGRHQGNVLRLAGRAVLQASGHGDV